MTDDVLQGVFFVCVGVVMATVCSLVISYRASVTRTIHALLQQNSWIPFRGGALKKKSPRHLIAPGVGGILIGSVFLFSGFNDIARGGGAPIHVVYALTALGALLFLAGGALIADHLRKRKSLAAKDGAHRSRTGSLASGLVLALAGPVVLVMSLAITVR